MKKGTKLAYRLEKELFLDALLLALGVFVVSTLYENNVVLTAIIVLGWLVAAKFWHTRNDTILFIVAAIAGATTEIVAIRFGAWKYANPSFLGIPLWLPFLWGSAVVFMSRVSDTISRFINIGGKDK